MAVFLELLVASAKLVRLDRQRVLRSFFFCLASPMVLEEKLGVECVGMAPPSTELAFETWANIRRNLRPSHGAQQIEYR
eukprot:scaffold166408_cov36-Prasinocladus_malaysianus.AAC.1